jgi:3-oxoacyl-[acyl-carrier protein] reductase
MLAHELAPRQMRVNSVAPGSILYPGGTWERAFQANPAFEKDFISHDFRPDGSESLRKWRMP